jgi:transcription elongation factor GreB
LRQSLSTAEVVEPPAENDGVVRFGATVVVRDARGEESRYQLVGVDEANPGEGAVSWLSPLAQALINARRGERVQFRTPGGDKELEIVHVDYEQGA